MFIGEHVECSGLNTHNQSRGYKDIFVNSQSQIRKTTNYAVFVVIIITKIYNSLRQFTEIQKSSRREGRICKNVAAPDRKI